MKSPTVLHFLMRTEKMPASFAIGKVKHILNLEQIGIGNGFSTRTDGVVFMKNGYPTVDLFGFEGESYYHEPMDTLEVQNSSVLEDAAQLLYWSIINAANAN